MSAERWQRLKRIFQDSLEQAGDARGAFLDRACAGDADLRAEIEALLASHDEADGFLSRPVVDAPGLLSDETPALEGRRIGAYRILGELGHGGMGPEFVQPRAVAATALAGIGEVQLARRQHGAAVRAFERARAEREAIAAREPGHAENRRALAATYRAHARVHTALAGGRPDETACRFYSRAVQQFDALQKDKAAPTAELDALHQERARCGAP